MTTGTGTLRKHLSGEHIEEWVTGCDNLGIKVTAEGALPAVCEFHAIRPRRGASLSVRERDDN